ncbi:MAG TPA: tetratricopeptide repeat protein [Burkholderiaceae bacterium]|nr:tetratricopeptide repeat protein [Burkholderiaceae bacterium]
MKNVLVIVTLSAALSACATGMRQSPSEADDDAITVAAANAQPSGYPVPRNLKVKSRASATEDPLPSVELTEDLMVKYLSAEIADQRGNWQAAYITMLSIAQQTRDPRIARRAAEIALNAKQPNEALAAIRLWREVAPHSEEASQYYLGFVMLSDNLADALPILQQRLQEARPQMRGALILQIQRLLARAKNKNEAFSLLEELLAPYKSMLEAHLALAQGAFIQGNNARASQEAHAALAADPSSELAALTLAQVTPDKNKAAKSLAGFLAANPKSREVRLAYARMLVEQKQYDQAQREFKILLKEQPQDLTVLYALGLLGTQGKDLKEAETYLTTYLNVLAANPDEDRDPTQALLILAQIAEERNDTKGALKWLDQIDPGVRQAQLKRAQLIAKDGDVAGARKLLKGLSSDGEEEQIQLLMAEAQILRDANQAQQAMAVLEGGLKRFPDNIDLLYDYAMLAEKINKLDIMETSLRKVIRLAPDNQHAYNALGYSLAERNMRLQEAFALVEKALQLAPEDPFIMDSMGWVQFRLGRLKEAESLLRRAYGLRPDAEIAVHLGEVLWVKGQQEDAKKLWRDANIKDPKNDTLKNTLARLQVHL